MPPRTFAIGDIHGCDDALAVLIEAIAPPPDDVIVPLGDYIDRGPNSDRVVDRLIDLAERCQLVPLLGDHEQMLLDAFGDAAAMRQWLECGGNTTLRSYGWSPDSAKRQLVDWIPARHREFLSSCRLYYETSTHLFMHAGYLPEMPLEEQPVQALLWRVTSRQTAQPHCSGKTAIVGHTRQPSGEVLSLGHLVCIDTDCVRGGWLTALDVSSGRIWRTDRSGQVSESFSL